MLFKGVLELSAAGGEHKGSIVQSEAQQQRVDLRISSLPPGVEVRLIVQDEEEASCSPAAGPFPRVFRVSTPAARFVRAEVWLGDRGIAFNNCPYFVPSTPTERT